MKCPYCNGDANKAGKLPSGRQRYICKSCKKGFSTLPEKETVACIYCSGETVRSGKTKYGIQIWLCKDCNKKFNENRLTPPDVEERCPYCDGELRFKGWSNNGHARRYICSDCRKGFSGDLSNLKVKVIDKPCPYCHSENVKKGGRLKSGLKRYYCNDCKKGFNEATIVKNEPIPKCPKCSSDHVNRSGKDVKLNQRYKCIDCGYKFIENPTQSKDRYEIHKKECPRCNHIGARRAGYSTCSTGRKQYFQCLECRHKYLENGIYKHLTNEQKQDIIRRVDSGEYNSDIAKDIGCDVRTVYSLAKKHCKLTETQKSYVIERFLRLDPPSKIANKINRNLRFVQEEIRNYLKSEKLSIKQKEEIYKHGVMLAVPAEFIAPYISCSVQICKEYLKQYKIVKPKRAELTEQEKRLDKMILDRFIS